MPMSSHMASLEDMEKIFFCVFLFYAHFFCLLNYLIVEYIRLQLVNENEQGLGVGCEVESPQTRSLRCP